MAITDPKDQVRLLINDVGGQDAVSFLFNDNEIETFLDMEGGNVFMASATALRTIANNEAQVSKRILFLELQTDGPAVAKALRELADNLESRADNSSGFDFATMDVGPFTWRELRGLTL